MALSKKVAERTNQFIDPSREYTVTEIVSTGVMGNMPAFQAGTKIRKLIRTGEIEARMDFVGYKKMWKVTGQALLNYLSTNR